MKKKVEEVFKPIYVALDTDVLRILACFHYSVCVEGLDVDNLFTKEQVRTYPLYKLIIDGKIKPIVTGNVLNECPKADKFLNFLNERCYMTDISDEEKDDHNQKVFELAKKYCSKEQLDFFAFFGYMDKNNCIKPSADAINMAESSLAGLNLITNNAKHFVYVEEEMKKLKKKFAKSKINCDAFYKEKFWRRAHGVRSINGLAGILYIQSCPVIPSPFPLYFIEEMVKEKRLEDLRVSDNPNIKPCSEIFVEDKLEIFETNNEQGLN